MASSGLSTSLLREITPPALPEGRNRYPASSSFTRPVRIPVIRGVVGDSGLTTPVGVDIIDLVVAGSGS